VLPILIILPTRDRITVASFGSRCQGSDGTLCERDASAFWRDLLPPYCERWRQKVPAGQHGLIVDTDSCKKPNALYGCVTWSLTLRGERKLRVLENKVLRNVFGPKRDEVTGERRRLHN
jgi:hypothetical protein